MGRETVKVFVGCDRSQLLAVKVLEHSIKRHTSLPVEVVAMQDLPVPQPCDPRNTQRTGFSFSRFCIPKLANYQGKAIYLDADMLVFRDIKELWSIPFEGAKVVIQKEIKHNLETTRKFGAPRKRIKQCAVMLLDCERLDWDIEQIIGQMNLGKFDYGQLLYDLCILGESEIRYAVPFEWNSLEYYDEETRLIHYTDMATQPWVSTLNKHGDLWFEEIRRMIADRSLSWSELEEEIARGFFRPSLLRDIRIRQRVPRFFRRFLDSRNAASDMLKGYKPHKAVYEAKKRREIAIREYEAYQTGMMRSEA